MDYGEARHGYWCDARTYPTTCRYCGQRVFYFSCACGCKVFFDALGYPWPQHSCAQYVATRLSTSDLHQARLHLRREPGKEGLLDIIDREYASRVGQREAGGVPEYRTVRQVPREDESVYELGYLRDVIRNVNVYKKFGIPPDSLVGYQLLGALARSNYSQITLETGDLSREESKSYTCLVEEAELNKAGVKRGDLVWFSLKGWRIPHGEAVWLCKYLELPS